MKHIILILVMLLASCTLEMQNSFDGIWCYEYYDPTNKLQESFTITLKQDNERITGSHIYALNSGWLLDDLDNSINGKVENGVASITIKSSRTAITHGVAKIVHIGKDSVRFTLVKEPTGGDHLIPKEIVLVKLQPAK